MAAKEMNKHSPTSFTSLPNDLAFNCLARVSRFDHPSLSLVSKSLRALISSPELEATKSRMGITENHICVSLNHDIFNPTPSWFMFSPFLRHKLKPLVWSPRYCPQFSTIVSVGSEIYIFGGLYENELSNRVLIIDCHSQQWRELPHMRYPRESPAVDIIDGKIYVIGGAYYKGIKYWGEFFDPKTQAWKRLSPNTFDLTFQKSVVPGKVVMGGKSYSMDEDTKVLFYEGDVCPVEIGNSKFCIIAVCLKKLIWRKTNDDCIDWNDVMGLDGFFLEDLVLVSNSIGETRKRVTLIWKSEADMCPSRHCINACKQEIWSAQVSFEMRGLGQLWGIVEWTKLVHTFHNCNCSYSSVMVTC